MEENIIEKIEKISLNTINQESYNEKKGLKSKIRDLENIIETKILQLQNQLKESKEKEKVDEYDFSEILNEFKEDIKKKLEETNELIIKKIEEQNIKHLKLFNILVSLKNENSSINKSISLLNERIHMIEEDIGD
ncbi:conserved Plasmodium protein, unknown function [Plasmodium gallinaceum]|uniref:Uncharacterized protein n=1 Tax=Plasmodium gallinaceum TaxID=5849 RepID=A0A1J1GR08_PLAGA|nr:conserved Plasmodium protein, unknown function [Plasmodium gallinaceum]CRG94975.1 conserved Plasmodium protein, unknown function [Plasmodium gallinaceum]